MKIVDTRAGIESSIEIEGVGSWTMGKAHIIKGWLEITREIIFNEIIEFWNMFRFSLEAQVQKCVHNDMEADIYNGIKIFNYKVNNSIYQNI